MRGASYNYLSCIPVLAFTITELHPPSSLHQGIVDVAQACPKLEVLCVRAIPIYDLHLEALSAHTSRLVELNLVMVSRLGKISILFDTLLGCPLHCFIHSNWIGCRDQPC